MWTKIKKGLYQFNLTGDGWKEEKTEVYYLDFCLFVGYKSRNVRDIAVNGINNMALMYKNKKHNYFAIIIDKKGVSAFAFELLSDCQKFAEQAYVVKNKLPNYFSEGCLTNLSVFQGNCK